MDADEFDDEDDEDEEEDEDDDDDRRSDRDVDDESEEEVRFFSLYASKYIFASTPFFTTMTALPQS